MEQIDWKNLGFDAYRTRTVVFSHYKDGKWSEPEMTETFLRCAVCLLWGADL